ncbi:MAG: hypothetical protein PQJ59_16580 [Spirochaetales bacterium]|nr:hypothetical protein [Spirochaetales bacterium]
MKRLVLLVLVIFVGCEMYDHDTMQDDYNSDIYSGKALYNPGLEFSSLEEIGEWIGDNISYCTVSGYVQNPQETIESGKGDCKACAVLFMNLAYFSFGVEPDLICVDTNDVYKSVVDGGCTDHAMVLVNGDMYEPQNGDIYYGSIGYSYSFSHVF